MNIKRAGIVLAVSAFAGLFEAAFSTFLPMPWSALHPSLLLVSLFSIRESPRDAFLSAIISGIFLDAFAVSHTFAFARFIVVVFALWFFTHRILTNHSLYTALAIVFAARAIDQVVRVALQYAMRLKEPNLLIAPIWPSSLISGLWDATIVILVFSIQTFMHRRFLALHGQTRE